MKPKPSGHIQGESMNKLKQICKETDKFDRKIIGREFLIGKYFDAQKPGRVKRMKKFTRTLWMIVDSKIEKLLNIQEQLVGNQRTYEFY